MLQSGPKPKLDAAVGDRSPIGVVIAQNDAETIDMVREAISLHRLRLAYQPVVLTRDPGTIAFYEGLIRILDPSGRAIPAKDFIETVENTDLGRQIDASALELGLGALMRHPALRISINMSALSIPDKRWNQVLEKGLKADPTVGERLILEITESSAMVNPGQVIAFMDRLQSKGVAFALDDFGSGYTAIRFFKDFFFDILKLDGQFIRNIHNDPDNAALTAALLSIGKHFQMFTVAEMVETPEEAGFLAELGVDCLQGHLFGAASMRPAFDVDLARRRA
jgi:EAL domain-containing protein (putative c-di-GMP-specific phosphodiesterase class I)